MICTFYAHQTGFEKIKHIITTGYPTGRIETGKEGESDWLRLCLAGGFLKKESILYIRYRQRKRTSLPISSDEQSDLVTNIRGLYGYVAQLPCSNEKVHTLFLQKITTLNCEFSIEQVTGKTKDLGVLISHLAQEFDAVLFVEPGAAISRSPSQHFLDKDLNLLLDQDGRCQVSTLEVKVNVENFDNTAIVMVPEQQDRKARSESLLEARQIKANQHLPCIESAAETILRSPQEIAQRVTALAITTLVATNAITATEALEYIQTYQLASLLTPQEQAFLANPTPERMVQESWKCECIYTLLWAIHKVYQLAFPDQQCNLNIVGQQQNPIGSGKDPRPYIQSVTSSRSKEDILDEADLYYRFDWACVDARINNREMHVVHPGVVYQRHYALNWLIQYGDQAWDDVSCDT